MKFVVTIYSILILTFGISTSPVWAVNRALSLDGDGDYVEALMDVPEINFTIELWAKTEEPDVGFFAVLAGQEGRDGDDRHLLLQGGFLGFRVWRQENRGKHQYPNVTNARVNDGKWHHIALSVKTGTGQRLYVDSVEVWGDKNDQSGFDWQDRIWIGFSQDAVNSYFNGNIDEVRIWNIARTSEQIQATMNTTLTGQEEGLVGYWNFDDDTANDLSPNGNDSILYGDAQIAEASFYPLSSAGEINTADGFNAIPVNQRGKFLLTMDIREISEEKPFKEIHITLPDEFQPSGVRVAEVARLRGDAQFSEQTTGAKSTQEEQILKVTLKKTITTPGKIVVGFEAIAGPAAAESVAFSVQLLTAEGAVLIDELYGANVNENPSDTNGMTGIAIISDAPVSPPTNVIAEPIAGENDVRITWDVSDERIQRCEIYADGEKIDEVSGKDTTSYIHISAEPKATISYTVIGAATETLKSKPSEIATVTVGRDTTAPEPPMEIEEVIEESGTVKITWRPSFSKDVVGYDILRGQAMDEMPKIATVPPDKTEYVDEEASETEIYCVSAVDDRGNMAMASMEFDRQKLYQKVQSYRRREELGKLFALTKRLMLLGFEGPEKDTAQRELIDAYSAQNRLSELATFYENVLKNAPTDLNRYKMLGQIYTKQRDFQGAAEIYEKLVVLAPNDSDAYSNLGRVYQSLSFYDKAIASLKKALELAPASMYFHSQLARGYAAAGKKDEILKLAEELQKQIETQAKERDGFDKARSYITLGDVYSAGQFYDKAIDVLRKSVELRPEEPYFWDKLARTYQQSGKRDIAFHIWSVIPAYGGGRGDKHVLSLAPSVTIQDINGKTISLSEFQDKLVFVNFWATWAPSCIVEMAALEEVYNGREDDLVVLGISVDGDDENAVRAYIEKRKITYPIIMLNSEILDAFEAAIREPIDTIPTTIVIGKGNLIYQRHTGPMRKESVLEVIESARAAKIDTDDDANVLWADSVIEFSSQYSEPDWAATQILGPPDTYPRYGDITSAWASRTQDAQTEFIKIGYTSHITITGVKVYETYNPGAISNIEAIDEEGNMHMLWSGKPSALPRRARIFRIDIPETEYKVAAILIRLDSHKVPGWNEIDAVGLIYQEE